MGRLCVDRRPEKHVFINRVGQPLTRFGVHAMVTRYAAHIAPLRAGKRVSPHTIRHTTATHLPRAGVDINTIRSWLGHVSLPTTNLYAEVDLEMKAKALATCTIEAGGRRGRKPWRDDPGLMHFLQRLWLARRVSPRPWFCPTLRQGCRRSRPKSFSRLL
jgi:integrase/recombinase XerD